MGRNVTIEVTECLAELDTAEWDALVDLAGAPAFYSSAYLRAYERAPLGDVAAVRYLLARRGGRAVAAVPLYLYPQLDPLERLRLVYPLDSTEPGLLSHVWHCYDTQLVTAAGDRTPEPSAAGEPGRDPPGLEQDLVDAVLGAMREQARRLGAVWYGFVNVGRGTPTHRALAAAGLPLRHIENRYLADLRGVTDLDGYLARARPSARHTLRGNRRRAAESGVEVAVRAVPEADLAGAAELCRQMAAKFGNGAFYPSGVFERFVEQLGPVGRVIEVRQHGRLVGVIVGLLDRQRFHSWAGGFDYEVDGSFSPYTLCFAATVELTLQLRLPVLEGGRRNDRFKQRHGLTVHHLDAALLPA